MLIHTEFDFDLQCGTRVPQIHIAYEVHGALNEERSNLVVFPTYYTGLCASNRPYFGPGRALDPAHHCILVPCLLGNGQSFSPSNAVHGMAGAQFPKVTIHDNVRLQRKLIDAVCPVERAALVTGWSMGGCQTFEWATQFPDFVERGLPFCASAVCSRHNWTFLEGVKAALTADATWAGGAYESQPERGLRAFGRAYAGWAFSSKFFNDEMFQARGYDTVEALLRDWEEDHLEWDANDLLCKLWSWQNADVSANETYKGDLKAALGAITAKMIVMPSSTDMYFDTEFARKEAAMIPGAEFRPFVSDWGHCAATPSGPDPAFMAFFDNAVRDLFER